MLQSHQIQSPSASKSSTDILPWTVAVPNFILLIAARILSYMIGGRAKLYFITMLSFLWPLKSVLMYCANLSRIFSFYKMASSFFDSRHSLDEQVFFPEISSMLLYIEENMNCYLK